MARIVAPQHKTGESLDERVVAAQLLRICLISALVEGLAQVVITVNILVDGSARQLIDPQIKPNQPVETYNIPLLLASTRWKTRHKRKYGAA
ncbi:hypothetical protein VTN96DRAFT_7616 [Rasamsonia emersonii]